MQVGICFKVHLQVEQVFGKQQANCFAFLALFKMQSIDVDFKFSTNNIDFLCLYYWFYSWINVTVISQNWIKNCSSEIYLK